MLADIINQKKYIIKKIKKAGIKNLYSVYLFGSNLWGYDRKESDVDLYIIVKKDQKPVKSVGKLSLHYQITPAKVKEKVFRGSWATYFALNYASYKLFGREVKTGHYNKENIGKYLERKTNEIEKMVNRSRHWCFQTFTKRLFFLNFYFDNITTFKLSDFKKSSYLSEQEKEFLEDQYVKIYQHAQENKDDNIKLKDMTHRIEDKINQLVYKYE